MYLVFENKPEESLVLIGPEGEELWLGLRRSWRRLRSLRILQEEEEDVELRDELLTTSVPEGLLLLWLQKSKLGLWLEVTNSLRRSRMLSLEMNS